MVSIINLEKKVDRRIQRTRALLQNALLELIVERGYDSLIIQDITDRANLRRATFYMHYRDKEELLMSALSTTFDALATESEHFAESDGLGGKTKLEAYLTTFKHVEQNPILYRNILTSQSGTLVARRVQDYLAGLILKGLATQKKPLDVPPAILATYIAGAELAMILWWLDNDRPYSAEQMAQMLHRLTLKGVEDVVQG